MFWGKDFLEGRKIGDSREVPMHHLRVGWGSKGDLNQRRTLVYVLMIKIDSGESNTVLGIMSVCDFT